MCKDKVKSKGAKILLCPSDLPWGLLHNGETEALQSHVAAPAKLSPGGMQGSWSTGNVMDHITFTAHLAAGTDGSTGKDE